MFGHRREGLIVMRHFVHVLVLVLVGEPVANLYGGRSDGHR